MAGTNGQTPTPAPIDDDEREQTPEEKAADIEAFAQSVRDVFPYTIHLTTPVQAHGERCATLTLQLPRTGDICQTGDPFGMRPGMEPVDVRKLVALISRLAGVPESTIKQLALPDLKAIELMLLPVFLAQAPTLNAVFSTSRISSTRSTP